MVAVTLHLVSFAFDAMCALWMCQLQVILNISHEDSSNSSQHLNAYTLSAHNRKNSSNTVNMSDVRDAVMHLKERAGVKPLSGNDILELFSNLFGQEQWQEKGVINTTSSPYYRGNTSTVPPHGTSLSSSSDADEVVIGGPGTSFDKRSPTKDAPGQSSLQTDQMDTTVDLTSGEGGGGGNMEREGTMTRYDRGATSARGDGSTSINRRNDQMESALDMLRQVDLILEQLGIFWANTEVVLDALTKKGQHAEHFVGFAQHPNLMQRFQERVNEYRYSISLVCIDSF